MSDATQVPSSAPSVCSAQSADTRAADALAYACAREVCAGRIDSRSAIADALLDYLDIGGVSGLPDVPSWMKIYEVRLNGENIR